MMMILNEEKYAKDLLTGQRQDVKSLRKKIELITRYNYHVLNKGSDDNYNSTIKWLEKHQDIFSEQGYSNVITDYIKKAAKRPFYNIDSIQITKKEIELISSQNNLRHEKILFVLLCMAKLQKVSHGFDNGLVSYNLTELFKMARVSVPVNEREEILHKFYSSKLIGLPLKNDSKCLFVKFINTSDPEDDVVLELDERDCDELAYAYLKFTGQAKIQRCAKCGKLLKQNDKYGTLCKECRDRDNDSKIKWCVDCGAEVAVNKFSTEICRCQKCKEVHTKMLRSEQNKRYYQNKKFSMSP